MHTHLTEKMYFFKKDVICKVFLIPYGHDDGDENKAADNISLSPLKSH